MPVILQLNDRQILRVPNADVQFDSRVGYAIRLTQSDRRLLGVCVVAGALPSLLIFFISRASDNFERKNCVR